MTRRRRDRARRLASRPLLRARAVPATGLALACAGALLPARAQLTSESFLRNHDTLPSYATGYTPGAGEDRVVVFIVASEYDLNRTDANGNTVPNESEVATASLGGVPLRFLGTRENVANKRNRLTLFYLPETEIPPGSPTFSISYTRPASSMIYIATALNIRQDVPPGAPVFVSNCRVSSWQNGQNSGRIDFAPIDAEPSDRVLSWVVTGDADTLTTFANGGSEFLDERRRSPGFSLSGALQSPQGNATLAGDAFVSDGCHKRPISMQFLLRPLGQDGSVSVPATTALGGPVRITVTDPDLDLRDSVIDTLTVTLRNPRTGQTVTVTATETGPSTGVFVADAPTANGPGGGGTLGAAPGDTVEVAYEDVLTDAGPSATRTARTTLLTGARLVATKTVLSEGHNLPQTDVLYRIEVRNDGVGPVDAGTVFLADALPALDMVIGDAVPSDGDAAPVLFEQAGAGLAFDYAQDVGFAPPGKPPASFADCPLRPGPGVAAGLGYLCVRPRGAMAAGEPDPRFSVTFRMRIP